MKNVAYVIGLFIGLATIAVLIMTHFRNIHGNLSVIKLLQNSECTSLSSVPIRIYCHLAYLERADDVEHLE